MSRLQLLVIMFCKTKTQSDFFIFFKYDLLPSFLTILDCALQPHIHISPTLAHIISTDRDNDEDPRNIT